MIVTDASALVFAVTQSPTFLWRLSGETCHAPHLVDAETGSALRRMTLFEELEAEQAAGHLHDAVGLVDERHAHDADLLDRAFALRHNLTFYDALYVALASALEITLVTADGRLAAAPSLPCEVELVGPD